MMKDLIGRMPGMADMIPEGEDPEAALKRVQGMIDSMTKKERQNPDIIDTPRRRRIAAGAGLQPHEVHQFLKQFDQMRTITQLLRNQAIAREFAVFLAQTAQIGDRRDGHDRFVKARIKDLRLQRRVATVRPAYCR